MKRAIFKVVVDVAFTNAIIFIRVFNDRLLKISFKVQDLTIVLQPLRCNSRDRVVDLFGALD